MNKPEWTIISEAEIAEAIGSKIGSTYTNLDLVKIAGALYQKKLLQYLIKTYSTKFMDIDGHTQESVSTWHLESMIKQLNELK
jgi:hypothetical protein